MSRAPLVRTGAPTILLVGIGLLLVGLGAWLLWAADERNRAITKPL